MLALQFPLETFCEDSGHRQGPPVLMVHEWPGAPRRWSAARHKANFGFEALAGFVTNTIGNSISLMPSLPSILKRDVTFGYD